MIKHTKKKRVVDITRKVARGTQEKAKELLLLTKGGAQFNTAFIGRLNGTFRERLASLTRKCRHAAARMETLEAGMHLNGVPDGICLDRAGAIWYGDVPNKRCVRVKEGGEVLQSIELDRGCFACMLGGWNMMTAEWHGFEHMADRARTGQVLATHALTPGVGWS